MIRKLHIWQFPDKEKILIKLNTSFLRKIKKFQNLFTKAGYIKFIKILKLCKSNNLSLKELERNITAYKVGNGSKLISHPKLPLKIDPIFDMVLAHHFFDGYICKDNKAGYKQVKDKVLRRNFKQKLASILGRVESKASEKETIFILRFLAKIFKEIYNIRSFGSFVNRIPKAIKNKGKLYKVAILTAAIGDEGSIESNEIIIHSSNKQLLLDLQEMSRELGYKCKVNTRTDRENMHELHIFSLTKFHDDFLQLVGKYPFLTLGEKEKWLRFYANKNKRKWWRRKIGETKQLIISLLSQQPMGVKDLEFILNVDRTRVRRHLKHLADWGIVTKNSNRTWKISESNLPKILKKIYIKTHHQFIELKKKKELSKQKILRAISKNCKTIPEIAKSVNLSESTIKKYLYELRREGKVERYLPKTWRILY